VVLQADIRAVDASRREYLDASIETMPRQELEKLQFERLRATIELAYNKAPLIRRKWDAAGVKPSDIKSLADYSRLAPFITKDEIRDYRQETGDPFGGVLCADKSELRCIQGTSGTTGDPTLISRRDLKAPLMESGLSRSFWDMGLRPGDYGIVINTTMRGSTMSPLIEFGMIPIVLNHDPSEIPRMIELIRLYQPKLLSILSNPLMIALEQFQRETGIDMAKVFEPMKSILWGGEPLGARGRKLTEQWKMNIHEIVSVGDSTITIECSSHTGAHAWEDEVLIEHLDPLTLEPAADGTFGELVVTPLQNSVDPLVRFRSEDLVWLTREPCLCGRTHVRFKVQGRTGDEVLIEGRYILPRDVWPAIEAVEETSAALFQIVKPQRVMERLHVRVGFAGDPDLADLSRRVENEVRRALEVPCEIDLVPNSELLKLGPPHKIPRIVKA
jgi:phenylacetate-CoA ligase